MPLFKFNDVCKVSISSVDNSGQCLFCQKASATKKIETWIGSVLVDSYLACDCCAKNIIVPAFEVQGAEISWILTETELAYEHGLV